MIDEEEEWEVDQVITSRLYYSIRFSGEDGTPIPYTTMPSLSKTLRPSCANIMLQTLKRQDRH